MEVDRGDVRGAEGRAAEQGPDRARAARLGERLARFGSGRSVLGSRDVRVSVEQSVGGEDRPRTRAERVAELGDFLGTVIAGIYEGIQNGAADNPSHYRAAAGRDHQSWAAYFDQLKASRS